LFHMKTVLFISVVLSLASLVASINNQDQNSEAGPTTEVRLSYTDSHAAAVSPSAPVLPSFTLQTTTGEMVNLQSFIGKKVFVNLWASWCPPCRREMPSIQKLALSVDITQVAFVMLSLDDDFEKAKKFVHKKKLTLPIYYPGEDLPALFRVQGIPVTFIFNEKGELIRRIVGGDDYDTEKYREILR
jgi:thiol-disulfide isomerase/thioredoxin